MSNKILNTVIKMAKTSDHDYKLSAALYKGGSILRIATNNSKYMGYRRDVFEFEPTRHAECNCMHGIPRDVLEKCNMLVVRVNCRGELASAKPCRSCMQAIKAAGITKLLYTNYMGELEKINPTLVNISEWRKEPVPDEYIERTRRKTKIKLA